MKHTESYIVSRLLKDYPTYKPIISECCDLIIVVAEVIKQYGDLDDISLKQIANFKAFVDDIPMVYSFVLYRALYMKNETWRQVIDSHEDMLDCMDTARQCLGKKNSFKEDLLWPKYPSIEKQVNKLLKR